MYANMNAMHLSANKSYEVQRTNNFEIVIADLGEDARTLALAVTSFPAPTQGNSAISLSYQNANVKVAGTRDLSDFSLTVKDLITADVEQIVNEWHKSVYDPETGEIGWAADYKKSASLYEYSPDGSYVRTWKLVGVWPSNVDYGSFSYDSGGAREITITLSVDQAYRE